MVMVHSDVAWRRMQVYISIFHAGLGVCIGLSIVPHLAQVTHWWVTERWNAGHILPLAQMNGRADVTIHVRQSTGQQLHHTPASVSAGDDCTGCSDCCDVDDVGVSAGCCVYSAKYWVGRKPTWPDNTDLIWRRPLQGSLLLRLLPDELVVSPTLQLLSMTALAILSSSSPLWTVSSLLLSAT